MGYVRNLDHIAVTVSDLDRSLAFYKDLLGFKEVERHKLEGETISTMVGKADAILQVVRLTSPEKSSILLDLQQYVEPPGSVSNAELGMVNHGHFCYGVSNLPAAYEELKSKGVEFISEPVTFDLGVEGEDGGIQVVFLKDPDGFILELMERT